MLVADDAPIRGTFKAGLETDGFRVTACSDPSAFFQALDSEIPDAVVLDFQLQSIISGFDIVQNLRLDDRTAELPLIALIEDRGDGDGQNDRAAEAGIALWLVKGQTTPAQLATRISAILDSRVRA